MDVKSIICEKNEGVATITFNRPDNMNSSNAKSAQELSLVVDDIENDEAIRAVIFTGGTKIFAAGGDIKYMATANPLDMEKFIGRGHAIHDRITASAKTYIAAIAGLALGGGLELALACDIRIAAENAILGQPEINLAIIPGAGGTQRLTRVVGSGWARHLILTGEMIDAASALKIGLVTKVVPVEELLPTANKMAKSLSRKSPGAIAAAKKCLLLSESTDLATGLAYEQKAWSFLFCSEDQTEGMISFLEKRKPVFQGR